MDKLDQAIADKKAKRASIAAALETIDREISDLSTRRDAHVSSLKDFDSEIRTLEFAASLRPAPAEPPSADHEQHDDDADIGDEKSKRRGGRQPGSISKVWRLALADLVAVGNKPINSSQFYLLTRGRLGYSESSVRERLRQYAAAGFLDETNGNYSVSAKSIEKFKLIELGAQNNSASPTQIGEAVNGSG